MVLSGCAAMPPAQIGQTAGTVAGAVIAPGIGAPIGSMIGLVTGLLVQGQIDKVTEKKERKQLGDQLASGPHPPAASEMNASSQGTPTRVWVDESVRDGRMVAGHFDVRYLP